MILSGLRLSHFRNYEYLDLKFPHSKNIFFGSNGHGKTNLLEAIYLTSYFKSFRAHKLSNLIRRGEEQFQVQGKFLQSNLTHELSITYSEKKKEILWNEKKIKSQKQHLLNRFCLLFSNKDIELATQSASIRRQFFDNFLSLISPEYQKSLKIYSNAIKQKERELQQGSSSKLWDKSIVEEGTKITNARINFIEKISIPFNNILKNLLRQDNFTGSLSYLGQKKISLKKPILKEKFYEILISHKKKELMKRRTLFGPHQDDIEFVVSNTPLREMASHGQMKLYVYALKLTIYYYWSRRMKKHPVILLDDIFADLDEERISYFFETIGKCEQVFITCANINLIKNFTANFNIHTVKNGNIQV